MKKFLTAVAEVAKDVATFQNKQLDAVIATAAAAVIAKVAGVHLTVAEIAGALAIVGTGAATVEKKVALAAPPPVPAPATATPPA